MTCFAFKHFLCEINFQLYRLKLYHACCKTNVGNTKTFYASNWVLHFASVIDLIQNYQMRHLDKKPWF